MLAATCNKKRTSFNFTWVDLRTDLTILRLNLVTCGANSRHALEEHENQQLRATLWATTLGSGSSGELQKQGASKPPTTQAHPSSGLIGRRTSLDQP